MQLRTADYPDGNCSSRRSCEFMMRAIKVQNTQGLARAVGVANFYPAVLADLCETFGTAPAVNQVELHPFFAQTAALENMKAYGVHPQAWGPLAEGKHGIFTDERLTRTGEHYGKSPTFVKMLHSWRIHD